MVEGTMTQDHDRAGAACEHQITAYTTPDWKDSSKTNMARLPSKSMQPALFSLSTTFLENTKIRFGVDSRESVTIHNLLGDFRRGRISKRETIAIIEDTLCGHKDLLNDLLNILRHQDARWAPEDFDLRLSTDGDQPPPSTDLSLLQPAHQSTVKLPSFSTMFPPRAQEPRPSQQLPINSLSSYEGCENQEQWLGPSETSLQVWNDVIHLQSLDLIFQDPLFSQCPNFDTSPVTKQFNGVPTLIDPVHNRTPGSSSYSNHSLHQDPQYRDQWQAARDGYSCMEGDIQIPDQERFHDGFLAQPRPANQWHHTSSLPHPSPLKELPQSGLNESQPMQIETDPRLSLKTESNAPYNTTYGWSFGENSKAQSLVPGERSNKRTSHASIATSTCDKIVSNENRSEQLLGRASHEGQHHDTPQAEVGLQESQGRDPGKPFIHALCGKAFASRAKVKKHHWGTKMDDVNTTTGCWAKHKKPQVLWDEHPSCQNATPKVGLTMPPARPAKDQVNAPVVSVKDLKRESVVPAIPTLQTLPQLVASTINHTRPSFMHMDVFDFSQRVPSGGSMEDLLSVVNAEASMIEEPTPRRLTGSIVPTLNAQAVAAEIDDAWPRNPSSVRRGEADHISGPSSAFGPEHQGYLSTSTLPEPAHGTEKGRV